MSDINTVHSCLSCGSESLIPIYRFPLIPLTDKYVSSSYQSSNLTHYPLQLNFCESCSHLQLAHQVSPQSSYTDYQYLSSITLGLNSNFLSYASDVLSSSSTSSPTLLDIGSNDGSFIHACRSQSIQAYGVEPASALSTYANKNNCPTVNCFFENSSIQKIKDSFQIDKFDFISFNNVLANIPDPLSSLKLARSLFASNDSSIFIQSGYHPLQFARGLFDYVYHEHFSYFSYRSLASLAKRSGLFIKSWSVSNLRGGSFRAQLCVGSPSLDSTPSLPFERYTKAFEFKSLVNLISSSRSSISEQLLDAKAAGFTCVGYGASHSTGILVHTFGLSAHLDFLVDDNVLKHSMFMPGTNLEVLPTSSVLDSDRIAVVILACQYYDQIFDKLSSSRFKGIIFKPVLP